MSVIAWDGERLAADKRATLGTLIRTTTKVFHLGDALAAYAGDADAGEEVLAWFKDGHDAAKFPASQRDKDTWAGLLIVWNDGTIWKYERTPGSTLTQAQRRSATTACARSCAPRLPPTWLARSASRSRPTRWRRSRGRFQ